MKDLLERLDAPEAGLRRAACDEALVQLKEDPELRDALRCLLRDGSPRARFAHRGYCLTRQTTNDWRHVKICCNQQSPAMGDWL